MSLFVRGVRRRAVLAGVVGATVLVPSARSESLSEVLAEVYASSPVINAQRLRVTAVEQTIEQARAGLRARIDANADVGVEFKEEFPVEPGDVQGRTPRTVGLTVTMPIFDGYKTANAVDAAQSSADGEHDALGNSVQNVLLETVQAYADVFRDEAIVGLRRRLLPLIDTQLRFVREDQRAGGKSKAIDVLQIEVRLRRATGELNLAVAKLGSSKATFKRLTGHSPKRLAAPDPADRLVSGSMSELLTVAERSHPAIAAAGASYVAADAEIGVARAGLYPRLDFEGQLRLRGDPEIDIEHDTLVSAMLRLTVPLYAGGSVRAKIREAVATREQRRYELDGVRAQVESLAVTASNELVSANIQIDTSAAQVRAAELTAEAFRVEVKAGLAVALDLLTVEQEVIDARVTLAQAMRDRVVASYAVLAAAGRMTAADLDLTAAQDWRPSIEPMVEY